MEITGVRVKLISDAGDRLKAVCTVTFDEQFVVRDVKVVEGTSGLFVAMPSRKVSTHCPKCGHKNTIRSRFCNDCGAKLPPPDLREEENGRSRLHRDIAHPITTPFREMLQGGVLKAYELELGTPREASDGNPVSAETVPPAEEPKEPDNREGGMTEYDAIIAGLRSGGRDTGRRESATSTQREGNGARGSRGGGRTRGPGSSRGNDRSERSDTRPPRRRDDEKPQREDSRRQRAESSPPAASPVTRAPKSAPVESLKRKSAERTPEPAIESDEGFGAGIMDNDPGPAKPVRSEKPTAPSPEPITRTPPAVEDDSDSDFGAGIL